MSAVIENISFKTRILNIGRAVFKIPAFEKMLRSKISKEGTFHKLAEKLVAPNYLYNSGSIRHCRIKDVELELDISDYVGHFMYFGFKDEAYEKLFSLAKAGNTVLDIGANIGFTALALSKACGNEGSVFAFEPDPFNFSRLSQHISLNKNKTVSAHNIGLGDKEGELKLVISRADNRGMNRIDGSAEKNFILVKVSTADTFVKENALKKIDLIKIDVEGFELNVLKGCENILRTFKPVLFIEVDDDNLKAQGNSAKDLLEFLESERYKCTEVISGKIVSSESELKKCHMDVVCRPI
jgi:FkbM family methyltransferase